MKTSKLLRFISALVCIALIVTMNPSPSFALETNETLTTTDVTTLSFKYGWSGITDCNTFY